MKAPRFLEGVAVALAAACFGSLLHLTLSTVLPSDWVLRLLIPGIGCGYLLYLFSRSPERVGRVTAMAAWALVAAVAWFAEPALPLYLMLHLGLIWSIRSLYFYAGLLPALADLGLSSLSLAAAVWANMQSGSLFASIWCLFLVQALFVAIPPQLPRRAGQRALAAGREDRFRQAYRSAQAAIHKLSSNH